MAANDVTFKDKATAQNMPTRTFQTAANSTAILPGEPVMLTTIGSSQYAAALTDAKPVIGTDYFIGIAQSASTHTASADGTVVVYVPVPGIVYRAKAKSAAAADTQTEIDALNNKRVVFDLTSSSYTVDTAAADGATNGIMIVGGDPNGSFIDFIVSTRATNLAF